MVEDGPQASEDYASMASGSPIHPQAAEDSHASLPGWQEKNRPKGPGPEAVP